MQISPLRGKAEIYLSSFLSPGHEAHLKPPMLVRQNGQLGALASGTISHSLVAQQLHNACSQPRTQASARWVKHSLQPPCVSSSRSRLL